MNHRNSLGFFETSKCTYPDFLHLHGAGTEDSFVCHNFGMFMSHVIFLAYLIRDSYCSSSIHTRNF